MNEKNYDYLKDQLKYTGFGEGLQQELKEKMQKNTPDFTIFHSADFGKDNTVSVLNFKKSAETDMYFFNNYQVVLKKANEENSVKQNFYINNNKEPSITLKEAYNLLNGRSVYKEELVNKQGEKYNAWLQLNFKETDASGNYKMKPFHQNYGYDLDATLAKHPIKELLNEKEKERLMESLQRGNRQFVTLQLDGKEQKIFIEASPQFKSLNFYDSSMSRIKAQELYQKNGQSESVKQETKKEAQKQGGEDDEGEGPKQSEKKSRRRKQSIS